MPDSDSPNAPSPSERGEAMPKAASATRSARQGIRGLMIMIIIAGGLIGVVGLVGAHLLATGAREAGTTARHGIDTAARGVQALFAGTRTKTTVIRSVLGRIRGQSKLVVLTREVEARIVKTDSKTLWGIDLGTTTVEVRAPGKVQYVVPLEELTESDFVFRPAARQVTVALPRPRLDPSMVEVESDPAKVEVHREIGWARLNSYSGQYLEDEARGELRLAALQAGADESIRELARRRACEEMRRLLQPLAKALQEDVALVLRFEDDAPPLPAALPKDKPGNKAEEEEPAP